MGSTSPPPFFPFHNRPIDSPRPLKIGIIGAGISGIGLCIRLRQYIPSAEIIIWEKNPDVGGTWFENRYPGVKCDIPSHVYQYTFEPNSQWSQFFSGGEEIEEYVRGVSRKYKVREKVRFERRVVAAKWKGEAGKWEVDVEGVGQEEEREKVDVDVLVNATGCLNNWKLPEIEGLGDFEGEIMHSACWDQSW
jgi:cation diffusion facilitator CzcD-associated flavoprotein CzcO